MPLKILLADDSPAIKKVIQLSLQDFGVELKTVSSGKDVVDLARQFRPDIAFIDVMLPQKSGYDIASEFRGDASLKALPVVLLWSAFMAFDEKKFKSSGAQAKLEKPFEVQTLRSLVNELVPVTKTSPIAEHLEFPNLHFDEPIGSLPPAKTNPKPPILTPITPKLQPQQQHKSQDDWSMSGFQDINSFASKPEPQIDKPQEESTPKAPPETVMEVEFGEAWPSDNEWVKKDLKGNPTPLTEENLIFDEEKMEDGGFVFRGPDENHEVTVRKAPESVQARDLSAKLPQSLTLEELSELKKETRDIIEKVVWKLVPELAAKMIREEIIRLLSEEK